MDLDLGMFSHVVKGGTAVFTEVKRKGFTEEFFIGDANRTAWRFIEHCVIEHGDLPSEDYFFSKQGIRLVDPEDSLGSYLEELRQRKLWNHLTTGADKFSGLIDERKSDEALAHLGVVQQEAVMGRMSNIEIDSMLQQGPQVIEYYNKMKAGERGVLSPWETMNEATLGFWPGDFIVFVARMGVGKCEVGSTPICCAKTGVYKTLKQVVKGKEDVFTRKPDGSIVKVTPDAWLDMGTKECLRVITYGGRESSRTPEHPVMTVDGWKRTDELQAGDYVEVVGQVPEPELAFSVPDEESMLIAAMLADGGVTQEVPSFTKGDTGIVDFVKESIAKTGSKLVPNSVNEVHGRYRINQSHGFWKKWDGWGCDRSLLKNKVIPDRVFQYDNESLAKFLGMFWSCDGSFPRRVDRGKGQEKITFTAEVGLASKEMIYQLQRLFLRFGIHGNIRYKPVKLKGKVFDSWVYRIYQTSYDAFRRLIPITGKKAWKIQCLTVVKNPNGDRIHITPKLKAIMKEYVRRCTDRERVEKYDQITAELGGSKYRWSISCIHYKTVSRRVFRAFVRAFEAKSLDHLLVNRWDRVESIVDDGVRRVFDLTVMNGHAYVANDMVVHNTFALLQLARRAWMDGKKVLFIGTEMTKMKLALRFYALHLKLPYNDLRKGTLGNVQEQAMVHGVEKVMNLPGLDIVGDSFKAEMRQIEASVDILQPDIMFVDGIYLIKNKGNDRHAMVSNTADDLKALARNRGLPIVTSCQFNREAGENDKETITATNVGISDVIGWDADVMYALWRTPEMEIDRLMGVKPLKMREGKAEEFMTHWNFNDMEFSEANIAGGYNDESFEQDGTGGYEDKGADDGQAIF